MLKHEELFQRLRDLREIHALLGNTEDLHLDCKVWPQKDSDAQRILAKALCGFANAEGGVIIFGLEAKSGPTKYDPDLIQRPILVANPMAVKSRIESLVGDIVEPHLEGVTIETIPDPPSSPSGYVTVKVPPTDGFPCRSRKDSVFYHRIGSGTYPMEYYQIGDMFGRRRRPALKLFFEDSGTASTYGRPIRQFTIGIENVGRGVARFPCLRFQRTALQVSLYGVDGNHRFGLPELASAPEWIIFGGGADHVIYPGTILKITKLDQSCRDVGGEWVFDPFTFTVELLADEVNTSTESITIPEKRLR